MATRQQLITERLAQLTRGFARYVAVYDELVPFNSKQLAAHRETIALRDRAGSVRAAVSDIRFVTSLRRTLLAWGLGVRGSVLVPDTEFAQALTAAVPVLERLEDLRIDAANLPGDLIDQLWTAIKSLDVVQNKAKIVAGTKTLHHLLPGLVIPMDHVWTGMFFKLHDPEWQQSQERTFRRVYPQLMTVAQQVRPQQYVTGHGWRTSQTKILDNALIGFCKLDLAGRPAPMTSAPPQVTFDVAGYPPAKDGALSIFGAGHGHAPRVRLLLEAARRACQEQAFVPVETGAVAVDVVVRGPGQPPGDATNYLGGIGDVLEDKVSRTSLDHLGDLATVRLFRNDRQIRQVSYREEAANETRYSVTVRVLSEGEEQ
jgi:hypothetical protein